jgi:hypothetical protein
MVYNKEGVSARNLFFVDGRTRTNALAQMSKFIGMRSVSGDFVVGVRTELGMFEDSVRAPKEPLDCQITSMLYRGIQNRQPLQAA